jgi:hypothetical protein
MLANAFLEKSRKTKTPDIIWRRTSVPLRNTLIPNRPTFFFIFHNPNTIENIPIADSVQQISIRL